MNKERIMEAMEYIDPALIEAADWNMSTVRRGRGGWRRTAVIAACLCLVLAGTALAAELAGVRIVELFHGEFRVLNDGQTEGIFSGYAVEGDVTYFPVDTLSPDIVELDRNLTEPAGRHFPSWEKMEEFVGVDLMDNPVLEGAPVGITIDRGIPGGKGHYVACVNADSGGGVCQITAAGTYSLHSRYVSDASGSHESVVYVTVAADLLTERWTDWELPARHAIYYVEGVEVTREEYTAPNGLCAQIFRVDYPEEETVLTTLETGEKEPCTLPAAVVYNAEFLLNGMMFTVRVEDNSRANGWECDAELVRETMFEVLDGFVCTPAA